MDIADPEAGELRTSGTFYDIGLKVRYDIKMKGVTIQLFSGVKNILNYYQDDFDYGIDRDPGYVYGPITSPKLNLIQASWLFEHYSFRLR